jgi:hypothetical protein
MCGGVLEGLRRAHWGLCGGVLEGLWSAKRGLYGGLKASDINPQLQNPRKNIEYGLEK